jgi:hypothetical protein
MPTEITGMTGVSKVQDGVVVQADLAANVVGNGPAFRAYASTATNVANGVRTQITYATEVFDSDNCYAANTFTPQVAGYYFFAAQCYAQFGSPPGAYSIFLEKNTAVFAGVTHSDTASAYIALSVSGICYLNGSTDSVMVTIYQGSGSTINTEVGPGYSFCGFLARSA